MDKKDETQKEKQQGENLSTQSGQNSNKVFVDFIKTKYSTIKIAIAPVVILLLLGSIFITMYQTQQQQDTRSRAAGELVDFTLSGTPSTVQPGDEITVFINIDMKTNKVTALELNLGYPRSDVELTEFTNEALFSEPITDILPTAEGSNISLGSGFNATGGTGLVATMKFRALQAQSLPITITILPTSKVTVFGQKSTNFLGSVIPFSVTIVDTSNQQTRVEVLDPNTSATQWELGKTYLVSWRYLPDAQTSTSNVPTAISLQRRTAQQSGVDLYSTVTTPYITTSSDSTSGFNNTYNFIVPSNITPFNNYRVYVQARPSTSPLGTDIPFSDRSNFDFSVINALPPTLMPIPTQIPSPTPITVPTNTPTPTSTLTPTPQPTNTPVPSPTIPPTSSAVNVDIKLVSIGNKPGVENATPINPTRKVFVQAFNTLNEKVKEVSGSATFNGTIFTGDIDLGSDLPNGIYYFMIKLDNTLRKRVAGVQNLTVGTISNLPQEKLISADLNNDNVISVLDWNIFLDCFGTLTCNEKSVSDLNDNGQVDGPDYNIFLSSLATREGDGELPIGN